jgi:hypothetical protein
MTLHFDDALFRPTARGNRPSESADDTCDGAARPRTGDPKTKGTGRLDGPADDYLGPGRVVRMEGATPVVSCEGREVRAELALAFPYEPDVDDELLVIGRRDRHYVIGVLRGHGEVALRFLGDVRIEAVGGKLELGGDKGVRVRGDAVEFVTKNLRSFADTVVERANEVYRRIRGTNDVHSGEKRELVDGALSTTARSVTTTTSGVVAINGKEIHLG